MAGQKVATPAFRPARSREGRRSGSSVESDQKTAAPGLGSSGRRPMGRIPAIREARKWRWRSSSAGRSVAGRWSGAQTAPKGRARASAPAFGRSGTAGPTGWTTRPEPSGPGEAKRSGRVTAWPSRARKAASARPPIPAPTTAMRRVWSWRMAASGQDRWQGSVFMRSALAGAFSLSRRRGLRPPPRAWGRFAPHVDGFWETIDFPPRIFGEEKAVCRCTGPLAGLWL